MLSLSKWVARCRRFSNPSRLAVPLRALQIETEPSPSFASQESLSDPSPAIDEIWPDTNTLLRYTGEGVQFGIKVAWSLTLRADGAFVEESRSPYMSSITGFDGSPEAKCWEVDGMGLPKTLELDDHEHCLMSNWARSGFWACREARRRISIAPLPSNEVPRSPDMQHEPKEPPTISGSGAVGECRRLELRVADGEVSGELVVAEGCWQADSLAIRVADKVDRHLFTDWQMHGRHWFPRRYVHEMAAGSENCFVVTGHSVLSSWQPATFLMPPSPLRPRDASFEPAGGGGMPGWWTSSGHILVQPRINGHEMGFMILDTGASGFVIESEVADRLSLERFGRFHCTGMMDNVEICFRRASSIQLGPLTIDNPLFMEMQLGGLVQNAPGEVIGIIGYDVFRRCVMEIPQSDRRDGRFEMQVKDPSQYESPVELEPFWHTLEFVSSLPLIKASIGVEDEAHKVRLMIDSGAGGVDLMFNKRATDQLELLKDVPSSFCLIKGVGGSATEKQRVRSGKLSWMKISESRFEKLDCLFIGSAGLDLSHYVQGIICGGLVARCSIVLDFARKRIALLPRGAAEDTP